LIGVDGHKGAGKTCLAREIARNIGSNLLNVDHYIIDVSQPYVESLNIKAIRSILDASFQKTQNIVVDGLCLRWVLEKVEYVQDVSIYVMKLDTDGTPVDYKLFSPEIDEKNMLAEVADIARVVGIGDDEPLLDRDSIRYHKRVSPHLCADFIYEYRI
jgi:hypothetical protein